VNVDQATRAAQVRILRELLTRLERGDSLLPTDLLAPLVEELEQRIDEEAIVEAWALEGRTPPRATDGARRAGSSVSRRPVFIFNRASRDLSALDAEERSALQRAIGELSMAPVPRGAGGLHGRAEGHVQHRVGGRRLLYHLQDDSVLVVAITSGPV
jgi:mRNA-degrading endonuclease RelE of RelBE toxin-antitoxin system